MRFDIDMVFVLNLVNSQWMSDRAIDNSLLVGNFHLVPKPCPPGTKDGDLHWICSYAEIERQYMNDKHKLKYLIRFFKVLITLTDMIDFFIFLERFGLYSLFPCLSFVGAQKIRDTHALTNLKSYYIKTVFLWHDEEVSRREYWRSPAQMLFFTMLDKIIGHVEDRNLPFFWDRKYNMFGKMSDAQITDLLRKLHRIRRRLDEAVSAMDWTAVESVICAYRSYSRY